MARVLKDPLQLPERPHISTLLSGERDVAHQLARVLAPAALLQQNPMRLDLFGQLSIQAAALCERQDFAKASGEIEIHCAAYAISRTL
jgi:hypothetical protein